MSPPNITIKCSFWGEVETKESVELLEAYRKYSDEYGRQIELKKRNNMKVWTKPAQIGFVCGDIFEEAKGTYSTPDPLRVVVTKIGDGEVTFRNQKGFEHTDSLENFNKYYTYVN